MYVLDYSRVNSSINSYLISFFLNEHTIGLKLSLLITYIIIASWHFFINLFSCWRSLLEHIIFILLFCLDPFIETVLSHLAFKILCVSPLLKLSPALPQSHQISSSSFPILFLFYFSSLIGATAFSLVLFKLFIIL